MDSNNSNGSAAPHNQPAKSPRKKATNRKVNCFRRENLPNPISYYEEQGVPLKGHGPWLTGPCLFHNGSDSMRVHVQSGGFVCMSCGAKGGDVLAYHMAIRGLSFVESAKELNAYEESGTPYTGSTRPAVIPAKQLLQLASLELYVIVVILADCQKGGLVEADAVRLREAIARVIYCSEVANGRR